VKFGSLEIEMTQSTHNVYVELSVFDKMSQWKINWFFALFYVV